MGVVEKNLMQGEKAILFCAAAAGLMIYALKTSMAGEVQVSPAGAECRFSGSDSGVRLWRRSMLRKTTVQERTDKSVMMIDGA